MTRLEHLLTLLAEECNEVAQRATKALRFGLTEVQEGHTEDNARRLMKEWHQLLAVLQLLHESGALPNINPEPTVAAKKQAVEHWLGYSRKCGTLTEETKP